MLRGGRLRLGGCGDCAGPGRLRRSSSTGTGRRWTQVPASELQGLSPDVVAVGSATDAWLFQSDPSAALHWNGASASRKAAYAARYDDGRWTKSYLPALPYQVVAVSRNDIWATGITADGRGRTVLMHWNGDRWSTVAMPRRNAAGGPEGLAVASPNNVWLGWVPAKASACRRRPRWRMDDGRRAGA